MGTLKMFAAAFIMIGLLYLLFIKIFKNENYIRKAVFITICGGVVTLFFVGGFIYDIINDKYQIEHSVYDINYFSFLIVAIFYQLGFSILYFTLGYKRKQRFKNKAHIKSEQTINYKKEFIYIILKFESSYLLNKKDDLYHSLVIKFKHNDFFHDEIVQNLIKELKIEDGSYSYIGKAIKKNSSSHLKNKIDDVYFCYQIVLTSIPKTLEQYSIINNRELVNVRMTDFDKKIIFTSIIDKDFEITI